MFYVLNTKFEVNNKPVADRGVYSVSDRTAKVYAVLGSFSSAHSPFTVLKAEDRVGGTTSPLSHTIQKKQV